MKLVPSFSRRGAGMSVAAVAALLASVSAHAALPTVVSDAITSFQTDTVSLINLGWPFLIAVFGGMLLMKLFKKVANKAT